MYKYIAKYFLLEKVFLFCRATALWSLGIGAVSFLLVAYVCLFILPADATQSEVYRILFVHVPSAIFSELLDCMAVCLLFIYE